jgi:biotin carboxylase
VDAFSGKGIAVLRGDDPSTFPHAIAQARDVSPSGEVIVEEYVEGQLHSHSAFIRNGRIVFDFLVREDSTANPFVVDTSRVVHGSSGLLRRLRWCAESLSTELGLVDGLLHTQFISNDQGIQLVESTRRCPGDLYSQLIELTTGYRYARAYVLPFLGRSTEIHRSESRHDPIMRHTITVKAAQSLAYLRFKSAIHVERWTPLSLTGDQLHPSPQGRVGILFCRATDAQDLDRIYQATLKRDLYEVHT